MSNNHLSDLELEKIIEEHDESETMEYKSNFDNSEQIGEYISALGNSALMFHQSVAYFIWGVKDKTKEIIGTIFNPKQKVSKANQMPMKTFLETFLDPRINLFWEEHQIKDKRVVALIIDVSRVTKPISFKGKRYIRVGTSKKALSEFPEKERLIWESFESIKFESKIAKENVSFKEVQNLLDLKSYFELFNPLLSEEELIDRMIKDKLLKRSIDNSFDITNLAAYAFAKNMNEFPALKNRTVRITQYQGKQKLDTAIFDVRGKMGIINSFNNIVANIMNRVPYKEDYTDGKRKDIPIFPRIAVRELVANELVHQDFTVEGMGPTIEIFSNRLVFTNPGSPLIPVERFLDVPPISRNNDLANLMEKFHIVESRGTGIDKVVNALENNGLPSLDIKVPTSTATVVTLNSAKSFKDMSITERTNSIYWNACLKYVEGEQISNKSIRDTFKLSSRDSSLVSKSVYNAVEAKKIKVYDPNTGRKFSKYIPFWGKNVIDN